jgi:hypothetical protein
MYKINIQTVFCFNPFPITKRSKHVNVTHKPITNLPFDIGEEITTGIMREY